MFNVYSHTLTDFYHNHLDVPIHYPKKSPAKETECIRSSSGPVQTHPCLADSKITTIGPKVERRDEFICKGGVDAGRLLNLARKSLYSTAKKMGGNVLLNERSALLANLFTFAADLRCPTGGIVRSGIPDLNAATNSRS